MLSATLHEWKRKIEQLQQRWRGARQENERLRKENEVLRRREKQWESEREQWERERKRLERERERLRGEIDNLKRQLEEAQRANKRQAAPFSRGTRKEHPKTPGRKPGAAYGRRYCKLPPKQVDEIVPVPLPRRCSCRGRVVFDRTESQYQQEIVRKTIWRRFDIDIGHCEKCHKRVQGRDSRQTSDALGAAKVQLGPEALALAVRMNKDLAMPHADVAAVLRDGFQLQVNRSTIARAVDRVARRGAPTWHALRDAARRSMVNGMDETGWNVAAQLRWLWVAVSEQVTFCDILPGRGFDEAASILGADYKGWLTHDGWQVYYKFLKAGHQSCLNHLLDRAKKLIESASARAARFPLRVQEVFKQALALAERYKNKEISLHGLLPAPGPAQDSRSGARDPRSHSGFLAGGEGGRETLVVDARECRSAGAPSSACDLAPGGTCLGGCPTVTLLIPDRSVREAGGVFLPVRFCGRLFSKQELELIREIARDYAGLGITEIARTVCELLDWTRANGRLKDQECRRLLERLRDQGWLTLPPVRNSGPQGPRRIRLSEASAPQAILEGSAGEFAPLELRVIESRSESRLWTELIERYHYLTYRVPIGANLRYLVRSRRSGEQVLACLLWSSPAWKMAPRDQWIGWNQEQKAQNLQLVVNNGRYLILPWVHVRGLASKILGQCARQLPGDWELRYGYRPLLLETLVDARRFRGTCYRAANWILVGQTQGRGRMDSEHRAHGLAPKDIYLYPLCRNVRQQLCHNSQTTPLTGLGPY